jgi:hypothetical protein
MMKINFILLRPRSSGMLHLFAEETLSQKAGEEEIRRYTESGGSEGELPFQANA